MILWRSYRKPVIALLVVLTALVLLQGPMRTAVARMKHSEPSAGSDEWEKKLGVEIAPAGSPGRLAVQMNDPLKNIAAIKNKSMQGTPIIQPKKPTFWQRHLSKECKIHGLWNPLTEENFLEKDYFKHMLVDDKHKVIYCQIPKVATITWRRIFIISTGQTDIKEPSKLPAGDIYGKYDEVLLHLADQPPEDIKYKLKHYYKFMFVREPMERLLSAFRNKMLERVKSSDFFRKTIGKRIAQEYRPLPKTKTINPEEPDVKFNEFVQYLIDHQSKVPWNEHWDKYYNLCHPCAIQYDFVGKLERSQADANYVLKKTGMDKIALFPNRNDTSYKKKETKDIMKKYYSTLAISDLRNLIKEYDMDRRIFGYQMPDMIVNLLHTKFTR